MEGTIILSIAGLALLGGVAGLVIGTMHRFRPAGHKQHGGGDR